MTHPRTHPLPAGDAPAGRHALLDALPLEIAVLDAQGLILEVNAAWRNAAQDPAYPGRGAPPGAHFLALWQQAAEALGPRGAALLDGLASVLNRQQTRFQTEFWVPGPAGERWFALTLGAMELPGGGLVVSQEEISARKQAEIQSKSNELHLQIALEATGDGVWDWDLANNRAYLSPGYYALAGYDPSQVTPDWAFYKALVHPEDWPQVESTVQAHLRGEIPVSEVQYRMLSGSGAIRWVRGRGKVVARDSQGAPLRMVGHITDVTQIQRMEQERSAVLAELRMILDSDVIGLAKVQDQIILWANPTFHHLFGYQPGELAGRQTPMLFPDAASYAQFRAGLRASLAQAGKHSVELQMRRQDGGIGWFRLAIALLQPGTDVTIGAVIDINKNKIMEQALQASEARYRAVVEDQTEVICRVKPDGTYIFANEVFYRLFGLTPAQVIGQRWQPTAHADDVPLIEARLAEMTPQPPVVVIENRVWAAGGELRWMQFVNRGFFDGQGHIREFQSVGRDITERKQFEQLQAELLEENTRLGRELIHLQETERGDLARELHDELSQQLVAIRSFAAAIRRRSPLSVERNLADSAAIEACAGQIYAVSHRIMEGLHPQMLDEAGLVASLRSLVSAWATQNPKVQARSRISALIPDWDGETRIHLFRIVQECLANVARHARATRVRLFLGVRKPGRLRLVIRDDGIGMDLNKPRAGFGLLVMRERARNLGGQFQLASQPGAGVRILVEVPCRPRT